VSQEATSAPGRIQKRRVLFLADMHPRYPTRTHPQIFYSQMTDRCWRPHAGLRGEAI
jgi:hypothetical protein